MNGHPKLKPLIEIRADGTLRKVIVLDERREQHVLPRWFFMPVEELLRRLFKKVFP